MSALKPFYTIKDFAEVTGIKGKTLYGYCKKYDMPHTQMVKSGTILINTRKALRWIDSFDPSDYATHDGHYASAMQKHEGTTRKARTLGAYRHDKSSRAQQDAMTESDAVSMARIAE